jgi:hypothetical protein
MCHFLTRSAERKGKPSVMLWKETWRWNGEVIGSQHIMTASININPGSLLR